MNEVQMFFKLNKEIEDFIKNQKEVLRTYERDNPTKIDITTQILFRTLRTNLEILEKEKDIILGLKEVKNNE